MLLNEFAEAVYSYTKNNENPHDFIDICYKVLDDNHISPTNHILYDYWKLLFLLNRKELYKQSKYPPKHQYDDTTIGTIQRWFNEPGRTRQEINNILRIAYQESNIVPINHIKNAYQYR